MPAYVSREVLRGLPASLSTGERRIVTDEPQTPMTHTDDPDGMADAAAAPVHASPPAPSSVRAVNRMPQGSKRFAWIGTALGLGLFVAALVFLWHVLSDIEWAELRSAFVRGEPPSSSGPRSASSCSAMRC